MLDSLKPQSGKRWPRGQKFALSTAGAAAEAGYREVIHTARAQGRAALDGAQREWAAPLGLEAVDGVVLGELRVNRKSLGDLARALDDCGTTPAEVKSSIDRLVGAGLVEAAMIVTA